MSDTDVRLSVLAVDVPEARELYERDYALVRPDQHVAWRGNRLPEHSPSLFDQVTGFRRSERRAPRRRQ